MISGPGVTDAFLFEWKRLVKFPRIAWWFALAAFPPVIVGVPRLVSGSQRPGDALFIAVMASVLTAVSGMLGLLLSATPVVYAELEGKTWTYLAVRPNGKGSVLVGKYLAAASWSTTAGWAALAICFGFLWLSGQSPDTTLWMVVALLVPLFNLALGAALVFLGVLGLRRAMTLGLFYCGIVEVAISLLPAVVSKITAMYHVRSLWFQAADLPPGAWWAPRIGSGSPFLYVGALITYAAVFLGAALFALSRRQLVTHQED